MQKQVESYSHSESKRKNIPTEQLQSFVPDETQQPVTVEYQRRNPDLDPQLIWKGKYDGGDVLSIGAKPLYIQEKIHPKAIIENLRKTSMESTDAPSLFEDTFGMPPEVDRMDFYKHDQNWTNRMILGDSLQVMASLANREGLRDRIQTIYIDPPYGIKFNSNFQWSTTSNNVTDGKADNMTREPEMVKAYRDTWRDGIHSYLSYIRDRLILCRDLLANSGSIFIQISGKNVHRIRCVLDEVFGEDNFVSQITYATTSGFTSSSLSRDGDCILWYAKDIENMKYNPLYMKRNVLQDDIKYSNVECGDETRPITDVERFNPKLLPVGCRVYRSGDSTSQGSSSKAEPYIFQGKTFNPPSGRHWTAGTQGLKRLELSNRLVITGNSLSIKRYADDNNLQKYTSHWGDTSSGSMPSAKIYVVQTSTAVISRCMLMTTDPGDLVLDPTCGSGTTAYVAEYWGRRWITIDTSRVALALARSRLMASTYPFFILKDSKQGLITCAKENNEYTSNAAVSGLLCFGFVYEKVPRVTIKEGVTDNSEIDVIYNKYSPRFNKILSRINEETGKEYYLWKLPTDIAPDNKLYSLVNEIKIIRNEYITEVNRSIKSHSSFEYLYDKPFIDKQIIRVTGPFTVESLSPHRILSIDADGKAIDPLSSEQNGDAKDFASMIIGNLRTNGIQQSDKSRKLDFTSVEEFPGDYLCAEGRYMEGDQERRAGILIGPEFGTLTKADIMAAAREAVDCGFSLLVACAFHFDAQSSDVTKLGRLPIMKVMMNTDLMMGDALKGKGNLFVAFGEPDIVLEPTEDDQLRVRVRGVDIFFPNTGEVRSDNEDGIACWFVDTDYDQESFFVRQAYFLGAKNPYEALKKTLKADIDEGTWETLHSNVSRTFPKPKSGYVAVKVINHLGDEAMKVLKI